MDTSGTPRNQDAVGRSNWRAAFRERLAMSEETKNKLKAGAKTAGKVALGVGIVAAVAAGALLAYMHFSGLGISKGGFTTLGKDIKAFWDSTNTLTNGQIAGIVGVTTAGVVTVFLVIKNAKSVKDAAMKKINKQRESFRSWRHRRAQAALLGVDPNTPTYAKLAAICRERLDQLTAIQAITGSNCPAQPFLIEEQQENNY